MNANGPIAANLYTVFNGEYKATIYRSFDASMVAEVVCAFEYWGSIKEYGPLNDQDVLEAKDILRQLDAISKQSQALKIEEQEQAKEKTKPQSDFSFSPKSFVVKDKNGNKIGSIVSFMSADCLFEIDPCNQTINFSSNDLRTIADQMDEMKK